MRTPALIGLALLTLLPADGDVGRLHGDVLPADAYSEWLLARHGHQHSREYVREMMILRAAEKLDMLPTDAELDEAWDHERTEIIQNVHHGDPAAYRAALIDQELDPARHAWRQREQFRPLLALRKMAAARRDFSEDALRKRYKTIYGELGERLDVQVLKYDMWKDRDPNVDRPDLAALRAGAERRAREALVAWRAGADFAELLADSDDPKSDFIVDGMVSPYRKNVYGKEVQDAVLQLDEVGDTSPPIEVWDGYVLVRLSARSEASFEDARDEILEVARATEVPSGDLSLLEEELAADSGMEVLWR